MNLDAADFRRAMGCFATGVTIITLDLEGEVHGMTANAFASVSLEPLLVLVCVDHRAATHEHLHAKKRFGINVLCEISAQFRNITRARLELTSVRKKKLARGLTAPGMERRCSKARWLTWNAGCILRKMPGIIRFLLPRWRMRWWGTESR